MNRRFFLKGAALAGCSVAAHPFLTTVTLADAPWESRLVVIVLRGAMDGLDVVRPVGDPDYALQRPDLSDGTLDLDGYFGLHPALAGLLPLWAAGELGFVHAVSTPYRDKRSHFDGQDLLEAGTGMDVPLGTLRDGWLNRMLQAVPGLSAETAYAIGRDEMPVLAGAAPVSNWAPDLRLPLTAQNRRLLEEVYHDDPLFRAAASEAMTLADLLAVEDSADPMASAMEKAPGGAKAQIDSLVDFTAGRLRGQTRIAAFSQSGWDTHAGQKTAIQKPLAGLERTLLRLKDRLGPVWGQTTVLAMTEFGRTVRENGSRGTDHGTGGVMLLAGGAIRGGRIYGRWPGLAESDLYDRRDLLPTSDVRAHAAWTMRGLYGFDRSVLEGAIFPGLDMGADPGFIL